MTFTWTTNDGISDHETEIEERRLADCVDLQEAVEHINHRIQEDFANEVKPEFKLRQSQREKIEALIAGRIKSEEES